MAAHQFVGVIQFRPAQQVHTDGIHHDTSRTALNDQIIAANAWVEFEAILESAATARQHGDAQSGFGNRVRRGDDLGDTGGGAFGNGKLFHT